MSKLIIITDRIDIIEFSVENSHPITEFHHQIYDRKYQIQKLYFEKYLDILQTLILSPILILQVNLKRK